VGFDEGPGTQDVGGHLSQADSYLYLFSTASGVYIDYPSYQLTIYLIHYLFSLYEQKDYKGDRDWGPHSFICNKT
jgi:hypothetical protein